MKILVCGGRDYKDWAKVYDTLTAIHDKTPITEVVQGGALGADRIAQQWAFMKRIPYKTYHAEWSKYGKMAGPIRNEQMLLDSQPDLVVAFPGGAGTKDMIEKAISGGCALEVVK